MRTKSQKKTTERNFALFVLKGMISQITRILYLKYFYADEKEILKNIKISLNLIIAIIKRNNKTTKRLKDIVLPKETKTW